MDDARAVMDAVGSERTVVLGVSEGGPMAMLFAATYPERTIALILFGTSACWNNAPDYPFAVPNADQDPEVIAYRERRERLWGTKELAREFLADSFSPPQADDDAMQAWLADYMRNAASPGAVNALSMMNRAIDARSALPAIHVPTLVMARDGDLDYGVEETRWLADQIRGARFVSFPGDEHLFVMGRQEDLLDEIERFVATVRDDEADLDRVLATVMFTDMVGSTEKRRSSGTRDGETWWSAITAWCARCSVASGGPRSIPRGRLLRHVRRAGAGRTLRESDQRRRAGSRDRGSRGGAHG